MKQYSCPYCNKRFIRSKLANHIDKYHNELIPENYTALRIAFNHVNNKPLEYNGICTECKGETGWDEKAGRYKRQCGKKECKESFIRKFEENMMRTKGVKRITSTEEGQKKMLANRKISGKYRFRNGVEKTYTGSYEKKALEFFDKVLECDPNDIITPGPIIEYEFQGETHFYISDIYYQPYNLIIEVKDGGDNPNTRSMPEYRAKQLAKEKYIVNNTNYNYLRLTNNNFSQLLSIFAELKMSLIDDNIDNNRRSIHINEEMNALLTGYIPGTYDSPDSVYIVTRLQNNVFSNDNIDYYISNNCKLENLVGRNKEGILSKIPGDFLENTNEYYVFRVDNINVDIISSILFENIGEFVEEGFIYEIVFHKKMYTPDQILAEESAKEVISYYEGMRLYSELFSNYLRGEDSKEICICSVDVGVGDDYGVVSYMDIKDGNYRFSAVEYPDLFLNENTYLNKVFLKQFLKINNLDKKGNKDNE